MSIIVTALKDVIVKARVKQRNLATVSYPQGIEMGGTSISRAEKVVPLKKGETLWFADKIFDVREPNKDSSGIEVILPENDGEKITYLDLLELQMHSNL